MHAFNAIYYIILNAKVIKNISPCYFQRRNSLRMDKQFYPTLDNQYNYLSIRQTTRIDQTLHIWIEYGPFY